MSTSILRQNIGPLTTAFVPPSACYSYTQYDNSFKSNSGEVTSWAFVSVFGFYDACTTKVSASCWPHVTDYQDILAIGHFYSPGLACPSGFSTAFDISSPAGSPTGSDSVISGVTVNTLNADETIAICCPSGYTYNTTSVSSAVEGLCQSTLTTKATGTENVFKVCQSCERGSITTAAFYAISNLGTGKQSIVTSRVTRGGGAQDGDTTVTFTSVATLTARLEAILVQAPTFQLNWRPADRTESATGGLTNTVPAGSSATGTSTDTDQAAPAPAPGGLSRGGIAGIVVGGVFLLAAAGSIGFHVWRRRRRVNPAEAENMISDPTEYRGKPELEGTTAGNDHLQGSASGLGFSRKAELGVDVGEALTSPIQVQYLNEGRPLEMAAGEVPVRNTEHRNDGNARDVDFETF